MALFARRCAIGQFVGLIGQFGGPFALPAEEVEQTKLCMREGKSGVEFDRASQRLFDAERVGEHPIDALPIRFGRFVGGGQGQSPGIVWQGHARFLSGTV